MKSTLRPLVAVVTATLIGLSTASCGSDAPADAGNSSTGGADTGGADTARKQGVKFAACMRANGVSDFPDPDASGELTVDAIANGSSIDTGSAAWQGAIEACKDLQPAGFTGRPRSTDQQEAALAFAECMREHGVKDFPDPAVGEPLVDTNRIPSSNGEGGMATLNAAMKQCTGFSAALGVKPQ